VTIMHIAWLKAGRCWLKLASASLRYWCYSARSL
jgi:hypothetical protein